jgi:peptide-methionine (S)-S-oxide reductase
MKNLLFPLILLTWSCNAPSQPASQQESKSWPEGVVLIAEIEADYQGLARAVFAGGCFWCVEAVFERVKGVEEAISGYAGGNEANPDYRRVASGSTSYAEAVIVFYNPEQVSYEQLLTAFFAGHDPTQLNRQGPDVGRQYRSAIFYQNEEEKAAAEAYIRKLEAGKAFSAPIVTELSPLDGFYVAEGYHQDYYEHNPNQPYVRNVSRPKVEKFVKAHPELLKDEYRK